jgi:hypothetical protein
MNITVSQIVNARKGNQSDANKIFKRIFYDKSKPKVEMWLINNGISYNMIDEVMSEMYSEFSECLMYKYRHDKIDFEKFVWQRFKYRLVDWFRIKSAKKISMSVSIEGNLDIDIDIGYVGDDFNIDFESILEGMDDGKACFMARCIYYNQWSKREVKEYMGLSYSELNEIMEKLKQVMREYHNNEL